MRRACVGHAEGYAEGAKAMHADVQSRIDRWCGWYVHMFVLACTCVRLRARACTCMQACMCTRIQVHMFACVYVNVCGRIMDTHKDQSSYDDMAYVINYNIDADEDDQPAKRALAKGFLTGMELPLWRTSEAIRSERSCQKWRNLPRGYFWQLFGASAPFPMLPSDSI